MTEVMIWDPIDRLLWGVAISLLFLCSLVYLYRGINREAKNEKGIMYGFAGVLLGLAISRIFFFIADLQLAGTFKQGIFYGELDMSNLNYNFYLKCAYISTISGILFFTYNFERILKRTRFILTIISSTFLILVIISPYNISNVIVNALLPGFSVVLMLAVAYIMTKWSATEFKAIASLLFISFLFFFMGIFLYNPVVKNSNVIPVSISPIFFIMGASIAASPLIIKPEYVSRPSLYWGVIGSITLGIGLLVNFIIIFYGLPPLYSFLGLTLAVILVFVLLRIKKVIQVEITGRDAEQGPNILAMFARPQRVTEEEVSISKEKKICLVCKGKLARYNIFLCPECNTFYCSKCANALSDLENACWVCEVPFDESKPVRLSEIKEEEEFGKNNDFKKKKKK